MNVLVQEITAAGAVPALEMAVGFSAQRQRLLVHNIANLSTPNFIPQDASPRGFQEMLGRAIDARRRASGATAAQSGNGAFGDLPWEETKELRNVNGRLQLSPGATKRNILFHDRNNRDLERQMQDLSENVGVFRVATELLRSRYELMKAAIAERA